MHDSIPEHSGEPSGAKPVRIGDIVLEHVRDNIWVVVEAMECQVPATCDPFEGPQGADKIQYFMRPIRQSSSYHNNGQETSENS